jgi:hypothetical protein
MFDKKLVRQLNSLDEHLQDKITLTNNGLKNVVQVLQKLPSAIGNEQADNYPKYTEKEMRCMREKVEALERQVKEKSLVLNGLAITAEQCPISMGIDMYIKVPDGLAIDDKCAVSADRRTLKVFVHYMR